MWCACVFFSALQYSPIVATTEIYLYWIFVREFVVFIWLVLKRKTLLCEMPGEFLF